MTITAGKCFQKHCANLSTDTMSVSQLTLGWSLQVSALVSNIEGENGGAFGL